MEEKTSALEELCQFLLDHGMSEQEINSLLARLFEEETLKFIEAMAQMDEEGEEEDNSFQA